MNTLLAARLHSSAPRNTDANDRNYIKAVFDKYDRSHCGRIDTDDLEKVVPSALLSLSRLSSLSLSLCLFSFCLFLFLNLLFQRVSTHQHTTAPQYTRLELVCGYDTTAHLCITLWVGFADVIVMISWRATWGRSCLRPSCTPP